MGELSTRGSSIQLHDGRALAFAEYGDPAGYPVLYFHGTPGARFEGRFLDTAARDERVRLIAVDRPGYGGSTHDEGRRFTDWPHDVAQLTTALGIERFAVVGLSGGAPHAVACALAMPRQVTAACLVSSATPPEARLAGARAWLRPLYRAGFALFPLITPAVAAVIAWWVPRFPVPFVKASTPTRRREWAATFQHGSRGLAHELRLHVRSWGMDLGSMTVPVHVWHGEGDRVAPIATGRWLAMQLPGAIEHWLPSHGHQLIYRETREVLRAAIIETLAR